MHPDWLPPIFHGTLREHYLLLFGAAGAFGLVFGTLGAWIGGRIAVRSAVRGALREHGRPPGEALTDARLAQLTQAMDAVAVEVERISEAQRFTAKLLTERMPPIPVPQASRREPGSITPH